MRFVIFSAVVVACCHSAILAAVLPDTSSITGASIVESVSAVYYVNQQSVHASDDNAGTNTAAPLRTIKAALVKALVDVKAGIATKVSIFPGTYREDAGYLNFGTDAGKTTLLIIEGTEPDKIIISGADVFTGWTSYNGNLYQHEWLYDFGNNFYDYQANALAHRCELVIIDGHMQKQRILENYSKNGNKYDTYLNFTAPENALTAGTYGVAERDENGNKIFVYPPSGTDMTQASVEVAVRHSFVTISSKSNLVLRNLTFRHFANRFVYPWSAEYVVTIYGAAHNVLIDHCTGEWNNGYGSPGVMYPNGANQFTNATQRDCRYNYNGLTGGGIDGFNVIIEGSQTNFNCWRGYWGDHTSWDIAGMKYHTSQNLILRNHEAIGNLTEGIWFDIHCQNISISGLTSVLNLHAGLFTEISKGPFLVQKSLLALNGSNDYLYYTVGDMTFKNNIVYGTRRDSLEPSVKFFWYARPGNAHWEQSPFVPGSLSFTGNVIVGDASEEYLTGFFGNPTETPQFHTIYQGSNNMWYHYSGTSVRRFLCGTNWQPDTVDYNGWKTFWGTQENTASWADPQFTDAANLDFTLKTNSPLSARAAELLLKKIPMEKLKDVEQFFTWAGYDYPVPSGTPTIVSPIQQKKVLQSLLVVNRKAMWITFDLRGRRVEPPRMASHVSQGIVITRTANGKMQRFVILR